MDPMRMDALPGVLQAIVAPVRGSGYLQQLPRTRQDLALEQTSANAQGGKIDLPVDNPNQEEEEELPFKYPIVPQHCRRWRKPQSYVLPDLSTALSERMRVY